MRNIIIAIHCDVCQEEIEEEVEGASHVWFTVRGEERELDLCDGCLRGSILQQARPVANRRKQRVSKKRKVLDMPEEEEFPCECGMSFRTQRGRKQHQTVMNHG